jgi:hypothetical protein
LRFLVLVYLHAWHILVQTFRRIHIRSSARSRKPTQVRVVDLPQNLVVPLPSIRPPIPAVVNPRVDIAPGVRFASEPSLWPVTRFVNPGYVSSTFETPDVELGQLNVYHLAPLPPSHALPSVQPPPSASVTPFKPSLFVKASQLFTKSEPFSNACPSCLDGQITHRSPQVVECGGYSDIYEGTLRGHLVAIKVFRSFTSSSRKKLARSKLQKALHLTSVLFLKLNTMLASVARIPNMVVTFPSEYSNVPWLHIRFRVRCAPSTPRTRVPLDAQRNCVGIFA